MHRASDGRPIRRRSGRERRAVCHTSHSRFRWSPKRPQSARGGRLSDALILVSMAPLAAAASLGVRLSVCCWHHTSRRCAAGISYCYMGALGYVHSCNGELAIHWMLHAIDPLMQINRSEATHVAVMNTRNPKQRQANKQVDRRALTSTAEADNHTKRY